MRSTTSLILLLASLASARQIPANVKAFYNAHIDGTCSNPVSTKFNSGQANSDTVYCKDNVSGALYLKDAKKKGYADADIDCDGLNADKGDCKNDPTGQNETAFKDSVAKLGIEDLDAHIHNYVVFGNEDGSVKFNPQDYGIKPLSVMAIICGSNMYYGVWGDTNGGSSTGEVSLSLGQMCFPSEGLNGDAGHETHDVLYLVFPGDEAVPGKNAKWTAKSPAEFEASLITVGDKLVAKLGTGSVKSRVIRAVL